MTANEAIYWPSAARRRGRRALRVVAATGFAVALALSLPPLMWPSLWGESLMVTTVVIGMWIPTAQDFVTVCIATACCALIVARVVAEPRRDTPVRLALANAAFGLAIPVTLFIALISLLGSSEYYTLSETSPGGCRLVIRDHSVLNRGSSEVGVLQPGSLRPSWTDDFSTWDGRSPYREGAYRLEWRDQTADLTLVSVYRIEDVEALQCVR